MCVLVSAVGSSTGATVETPTGVEVEVKPSPPVHIKGGKSGFMGRPIWNSATCKAADKMRFADWWDRNDFKDMTAIGQRTHTHTNAHSMNRMTRMNVV